MSRRLLALAAVDHPGGAETTLLRLLSGLSARGWSIMLTTPGPGPLSRQALDAGYAWRPLPLGGLGRRTGARAAASWPAARRLVRQADVVYLNGGICTRVLPALGRRRRGRARVVLHIHDIVRRVPRFWRGADVVLAPSEAVAGRLPGLDVHVVYPPADPDPAPTPAPWLTGNGPVVGFVGRLERRKGPLDLTRVAPAIRRGAPGARIVIVGEERPRVDPGYAEEVRTAPEVEQYPWSDNAPGLMRHLDVLVLPSYEEPAGTVLAEAMAVGTPVVATTVDGLPEVVRDGVTGRLVAPGDGEALTSAVLEVLDHHREMGAAARAHAERFHTAEYVRRLEQLIAA